MWSGRRVPGGSPPLSQLPAPSLAPTRGVAFATRREARHLEPRLAEGPPGPPAARARVLRAARADVVCMQRPRGRLADVRGEAGVPRCHPGARGGNARAGTAACGRRRLRRRARGCRRPRHRRVRLVDASRVRCIPTRLQACALIFDRWERTRCGPATFDRRPTFCPAAFRPAATAKVCAPKGAGRWRTVIFGSIYVTHTAKTGPLRRRTEPSLPPSRRDGSSSAAEPLCLPSSAVSQAPADVSRSGSDTASAGCQGKRTPTHSAGAGRCIPACVLVVL